MTPSELSWIASTVSLGQVIVINHCDHDDADDDDDHDDDHGRYHNPCRSEVQWRVPG